MLSASRRCRCVNGVVISDRCSVWVCGLATPFKFVRGPQCLSPVVRCPPDGRPAARLWAPALYILILHVLILRSRSVPDTISALRRTVRAAKLPDCTALKAGARAAKSGGLRRVRAGGGRS